MKICIVEDEKVLREELAALLSSYGYECCLIGEHFENAVETILNENPSLILLDLNLPGVDGYYICRELRKETEIPIIMVTSRDTEMDELMGETMEDIKVKPGESGYITYEFNELENRVPGMYMISFYDTKDELNAVVGVQVE